MKDRLKNIRLTLGYTQQEMADKLNVPLRTYRTYEYVSKGYPVELIKNLITILNVNANYLFSGIGEMFINSENKYKRINNKNVKENFQSFGLRLSELQSKTNISDNDFAKLIGLYTNEFIELKKCKRKPNLDIINILKQNFDFSADWLLYGD